MTLSVLETAQAMPAIRGVPQVRVARASEGPGIPARDLEALLGMFDIEPRQMSPFRVAARNRVAMDPDAIVGVQSFLAMREEAVRRCLPDAADVFDGLAELTRSGELEEILAGVRTPSVTRAAARTLSRYGKNAFDIGDSVLHKEDPTRGRGIVIDYADDLKSPIVQWNAFEMTEESPGDLTRTATAAPAAPDPMDGFVGWLQGALSTAKPGGRFSAAAARQPTANDVVRRKLAKCGLMIAPEISTVAFVDDPSPHNPAAIPTGHARVIVRARSTAGANLELEIPVPYQGNDFQDPDVFSFGGSTYLFTPRSLQSLFEHYAAAPIPHMVAPFQAGPNQVVMMPAPPANGVFASPPDMPARYPGF